MPNGINNKKWVAVSFWVLAVVTLLTPFWVFKDLLFPYITSKAYFLRISVDLALPFYVFLLLKFKHARPSFKNPLTIAVVAFLFFSIISSILGVNPLRSFWGNFERMGGTVYLAHLTLVYFYVMLFGQLGQNYLRRFLLAIIYTSAGTALYGLMTKITANHFILNDPSYPRVSATFGNPIFFASYLILPMFLTVYYLLAEEKRWLQVIYALIAALELWAVLLSETRGAVVGLVLALFIGAIIYVVLTKNKKVRVWGGAGIILFCVLVGVAFTFHNSFPQSSMLGRVFRLKDTNTEARLVQWGVALRGYKDRPLLGVGPENYYYISNKYYNPEIYQYDPSWFDKPHNYSIEVLVTTGIFGFAAYAAMLIACVWILILAYRRGLFSLLEFCLLLAGFLTYNFQNLFVFDTISASLMFFAFLGFTGFLWHASQAAPNNKNQKKDRDLDPIFIGTATVLTAIGALYFVYVGNVTGMQVAKDVNYGYAYSGVDPQIAKTYFTAAQSSPFDFDPVQSASKYVESAIGIASNPGSQSADFVKQYLQDAMAAEQDAVSRVPNDPTAWQELSNLYLTESILYKTPLDPKAIEAAQKGIDLAPKRPEPIVMMARLDIFQGDYAGAENLLKGLIANIPQDYEAQLQLAVMYAYEGKTDQALALGEKIFASGYKANQAGQVDWMGKIYDQEKNYAAAAAIYEKAVQIDPNNLQDEWALAQDYAKLGKNDQAKAIAQFLISQDSKDAQAFQAFINSLK